MNGWLGSHYNKIKTMKTMKNLLTLILTLFSTVVMGQYTLTESRLQSVNTSTLLAEGYNLAMWTPPSFNTTKKYKTLLFLHGAGEDGAGTNNFPRLYGNGLPKVMKDGFIPPYEVLIFAVQANYGRLLNPQLEGVVKALVTKYPNIDTTQFFLTGLSFGAQTSIEATLDNGKEFTKKFAAIIAFSPPVTPKKDISWIKETRTPYWLLAGTQSADLNYRQNAQATANLINAQIPNHTKLTLAAGIGHGGSFTSLYNGTFRDGVNFWEYIASINPNIPTPPPPPVVLTVTKAYHDSVVNVLQTKLNNIKIIVNN
jgi:predicted esterase